MSYRILHCLRAPVGGLFRHVRDLAAAQADQGHEVGVLCDDSTYDALTGLRLNELYKSLSLGLTQTAMARRPTVSDLGVVARTTALARDQAINILHGHGAKGGAYARLAARRLRRAGHAISCIYTPHGGSLHYNPASVKGRAYMTLERRLARYTDGIAFESAYSARVYDDQIGPARCHTAIIPNGLLAHDFDPVTPAQSASDFLFIGELRHLKGVDILLQALKILNTTRTVTATIVGGGRDAAQFKTLCTDLDLDDVVTFAGALPAREAFTRGRALVMPSRAESFPYIILEAAAAKLPLLASNVGGIGEITAGTDTELLPPGDAAVLAHAMSNILDNPAMAQDKAARLYEKVASHFTVQIMATGIGQLYDLATRAP